MPKNLSAASIKNAVIPKGGSIQKKNLTNLFTGGVKSKTAKVAPLSAKKQEESGSHSGSEDDESDEINEDVSFSDDQSEDDNAAFDVEGFDEEDLDDEEDEEAAEVEGSNDTRAFDMSALPVELQQLIETDSAEFLNLLKDFKNKVSDMRGRLAPLLERIHSGDLPTSNGVSLLEVKVHSLLSYITNLGFYLMLKLHGHSISGHPVIHRLIELRIVLEKIKPLEAKLKYQIEKLVKAAAMEDHAGLVEGGAGGGVVDPLAFRPNPGAMMMEGGAEAEQTDTPAEKSGIYRPPKLAPKPYLDPSLTTTRTATGRLSQRALEKASRSRMLADLRTQFDSRPEELTAHGTGYAAAEMGASVEDEKWAERERYEEENMVRLSMTREDKKLARTLEKRGGLMRFQNEFDSLDTDFNSLRTLNRAVEESDTLQYGSGVHARASKTSEQLFSKKRKFADAGEMVKSFGRTTQSGGGVDDFGREVKRSKRREFRKGRK
ncbi:Serine/threonine-protein kinase smg1 [Rhizophlyctis rosea]|uniref:Serine/threonine-protein kinase smg1 n=1 Tax=Rhizophlyctis rosea TaxID=64517 RepID=A0AAD5S4H1_9FUNG|nr:Serine/threonine-protein kinase smg1 [Rhizophlyctis rosea]